MTSEDGAVVGPVARDPDIYGGAPIFSGTRVPVGRLFEYLETGETVDTFLAEFPTVEREQVEQLLDLVRERLPAVVG